MVKPEKYDAPLFVVYDTNDDRVRKKIFTACEDYGLKSVQYSVFFGYLDSIRSKELYHRIRLLLDEDCGNFILIPVGKRELKKTKASGKALGAGQIPMVRFI